MTASLTVTKSRAMVVSLIAVSLIAAGVLLIPSRPASAVTYTITVQTDKASYSGSQMIVISGVISPAPGPNTATVITVKNANGNVVDISSNAVDASTGAYSHSLVAGGTSSWATGSFTVAATWGGGGTPIVGTTSFSYSTQVVTSTTTSTTTTSTTHTTSTTSTASTTSTTSTTRSTTSSSSTVPEFDSTSVLFVSIVTLSAVAFLARTRLGVSKTP